MDTTGSSIIVHEQTSTGSLTPRKARAGSLVLLGIISRRRQRLLSAAGSITTATTETLVLQEHLMDQYNKSVSQAVQLLGIEDPAVKDVLSSNPLPAILAGTKGSLQMRTGLHQDMEAKAQLAASKTPTAVSTPASEQLTGNLDRQSNLKNSCVKFSTTLLLAILTIGLLCPSRPNVTLMSAQVTAFAGSPRYLSTPASLPQNLATSPGCAMAPQDEIVYDGTLPLNHPAPQLPKEDHKASRTTSGTYLNTRLSPVQVQFWSNQQTVRHVQQTGTPSPQGPQDTLPAQPNLLRGRGKSLEPQTPQVSPVHTIKLPEAALHLSRYGQISLEGDQDHVG